MQKHAYIKQQYTDTPLISYVKLQPTGRWKLEDATDTLYIEHQSSINLFTQWIVESDIIFK